MPEYYLDRPRDYNDGVEQIVGKGVWVLRQTRFKNKPPHPHDIMAVDSPEQLREMADKYDWSVDWGEKTDNA